MLPVFAIFAILSANWVEMPLASIVTKHYASSPAWRRVGFCADKPVDFSTSPLFLLGRPIKG